MQSSRPGGNQIGKINELITLDATGPSASPSAFFPLSVCIQNGQLNPFGKQTQRGNLPCLWSSYGVEFSKLIEQKVYRNARADAGLGEHRRTPASDSGKNFFLFSTASAVVRPGGKAASDRTITRAETNYRSLADLWPAKRVNSWMPVPNELCKVYGSRRGCNDVVVEMNDLEQNWLSEYPCGKLRGWKP